MKYKSEFRSMTSRGLPTSTFFLSLSIVAACGITKPAASHDGGGAAGGGNTTGSGGSTGTGNATGSGGSPGTAGRTGSGGSTGTGNTTGSGGSTGTGNTTGSGGSTGTAGRTGTGGATRTGGNSGTAGSVGTGGVTDGGIPIDAQVSVDVGPTTPAVAVNLRTAGNYVILAKTGISTVPPSVITGNMGASPVTTTSITGFSPLVADSTNMFSTSAQVTGRIYAVDHAAPTPDNLTTAIGNMGLAYTDAASRAPDVTELGSGSIGGLILPPGVYKWGTGVLVATNVTLAGGATGVWIFEIGQGLTLSSNAVVSLTGGGLPKNVFWQVAGGVVMGTASHIDGVVLSQTSITLATGASVRGRLLAQTAVTLDKSTVTEPAP